jgi:S1-C subfamily serine protease
LRPHNRCRGVENGVAMAPLLAALLALPLLAQPSARAGPVESSVSIEVTRADAVRFNGYRLGRASEGMGVVTLAREVATAAHVVWGAQRITVIDHSGAQYAARIERIDPDIDAALLRVDRPLRHIATIRLRPAALGEAVGAVERRRANGGANIAAGTVWATRWTSHGVAVPLVLTGIKGEKGMSGGGLFDANRQLLGIVIRIDRTLGYLSALPVAELCTRFARCARTLDESQ